jgi:hypothetical protein
MHRVPGLAIVIGVAASASAATIHVDGTTGDDTWDGLCEKWD